MTVGPFPGAQRLHGTLLHSRSWIAQPCVIDALGSHMLVSGCEAQIAGVGHHGIEAGQERSRRGLSRRDATEGLFYLSLIMSEVSVSSARVRERRGWFRRRVPLRIFRVAVAFPAL